MSIIKTKPENCKYNESCSFYGADKCNDKQWEDTSECIIYELIEDVQELKNKFS